MTLLPEYRAQQGNQASVVSHPTGARQPGRPLPTIAEQSRHSDPLAAMDVEPEPVALGVDLDGLTLGRGSVRVAPIDRCECPVVPARSVGRGSRTDLHPRYSGHHSSHVHSLKSSWTTDEPSQTYGLSGFQTTSSTRKFIDRLCGPAKRVMVSPMRGTPGRSRSVSATPPPGSLIASTIFTNRSSTPTKGEAPAMRCRHDRGMKSRLCNSRRGHHTPLGRLREHA